MFTSMRDIPDFIHVLPFPDYIRIQFLIQAVVSQTFPLYDCFKAKQSTKRWHLRCFLVNLYPISAIPGSSPSSASNLVCRCYTHCEGIKDYLGPDCVLGDLDGILRSCLQSDPAPAIVGT